MSNTFYITTPIYYANSLPHLGHLYTTIVADVVARYKRQRGFDTFFLTGTDEHGINIQRAAEMNNRTPKEQVDHISGELKRMFHEFGLDSEGGGFDVFMRTTEPFHYQGSQYFWAAIAANKTPKGNETIYKGFYEGWFCAPCAEFKSESEYQITEDSDIPNCLIHERPLDKIAEESYFFRLSDYNEFLLDLIENDQELIRPTSRRNEILSFIRGGLQDLAISRLRSSVSWGIPVPGDPEHVMYVWLDALSNYVTAIGYGNSERSDVGFDKYWRNVVHLVGKDILRFHTVYWFSFLHAACLSHPKTVYAHGMWLDGDGRKMGKTLGNVIEVDVLHKYFQIDALRYFLLREMVFGQDGRFSYENLIDRINSDLASGLGNLASRTFSMIAKYRDGKIPDRPFYVEPYDEAEGPAPHTVDKALAGDFEQARDEYLLQFDNYEFSLALETVWRSISRIDKLISDAKPWSLAKDESEAKSLDAILYQACEGLRWICVLLAPVMPHSTREIYRHLGIDSSIESVDPLGLKWGELQSTRKIGEITGIFPRLDKVKIMNEIKTSVGENRELVNEAKASAGTSDPQMTKSASSESNSDDFIGIDDFLKVELRVGEILVAERIPDADKLLRFEIDLGEDRPRQILAGLAEHYDPERLIGRKVVVVANLKPRKMRGLLSEGMICAASLAEDDKPAIATFLEDVKIGARLK